jgi:hypothetical protein
MISKWESATVTYDNHGDKHFTGKDRDGSQWQGQKQEVNQKLRDLVTYLRKTVVTEAYKEDQGPYTFYYVGDATTDQKMKDYLPKGKSFTVQVDYDKEKNEVIYHGYPTDTNATGFGKSVKNLNITILPPD